MTVFSLPVSESRAATGENAASESESLAPVSWGWPVAILASIAIIVALEVLWAATGPHGPEEWPRGQDPYHYVASPAVSPRS